MESEVKLGKDFESNLEKKVESIHSASRWQRERIRELITSIC
jgi:hypothetical protein